MNERGVSPVMAAVFMVVLTILLASVFSVGATNLADFSTEEDHVDSLTKGTATPIPADADDADDSDDDADDEDGDEGDDDGDDEDEDSDDDDADDSDDADDDD